ncbi:hypothetical protein [uncultured Sulfitobacter sp.]|uniref:hypothetical protein n=1 Tax=uncultured Sulfitobacter sp. TaxID=191468 RepID=UPI00263537B3|nr:hypothetical protein [uncultured Sulfitobacter sp.]
MDWTSLTAVLALVTLLSAIGFAFYSKRKVDARRDDDTAPKSTLAKDANSRGKPADV